MKNILKNYVYLSLFLSLSLVISSCTDDDTGGSDAAKVIPFIFGLNGDALSFQSSTGTYSVSAPRGGSDYIWTANGAEIQPIEGRKDAINVFFSQAGTISVSVYEQAANGQTSDAVAVEVEVVCNPQSGDYVVDLHDSYGDGWQTTDNSGGSGITVNIDGTIVEVGMCNAYVSTSYACVAGDLYDAQTTVTIPAGTISASWNFPGDWYGEISFEIYAPDGSLAFASGGPGDTGAGQLPIVVCNED